MPIYKPTIPYFYIIEHIRTGIRYVGSKKARGSDPRYLLSGCKNSYNTSSKEINKIIELEGIASMIIIEIQIRDDCYEYETSFLIENNCAKSPMWYNQHNNTGVRDNSGYSNYYYISDSKREVISLKTNHPDVINKNVESIHHGKALYISDQGVILKLETTNIDVLSGKYQSIHKNMVSVKDENNNYFKVSKFDPRYISGELCGVTKGIPCSDERRTNISNTAKGKPKTHEHAEKISKALTGKPFTDERIKNIKLGIAKGKLDPNRLPNKRVCRLSDRKEMDLGNFTKYLLSLGSPPTVNNK